MTRNEYIIYAALLTILAVLSLIYDDPPTMTVFQFWYWLKS